MMESEIDSIDLLYELDVKLTNASHCINFIKTELLMYLNGYELNEEFYDVLKSLELIMLDIAKTSNEELVDNITDTFDVIDKFFEKYLSEE
jgi:hypothetical protein